MEIKRTDIIGKETNTFFGYILSNVLSAAECKFLIDEIEKIGFQPLNETNSLEIRNNTRYCKIDEKLANTMFNRIKAHVPSTIQIDHTTWQVCGLNEMLRFCKYKPGQFFKRHCDGQFQRNENEKSLFTFMVYLNDIPNDCGGETRFYDFIKSENIVTAQFQGQTGYAIIFDHDILHDGNELQKGVKYVLRTEIVYRLKEHHDEC
jgi:hypothetical protein